MKKIYTPFDNSVISELSVNETVLLTGYIYTARDAAHKRMTEALKNGEKPPFEYEGQVVFYAGPCPAPPGRPIGSIGPTTSGRMDAYSPALIRAGLKFMIGKGHRSEEVTQAILQNGGIYFTAIGGAAALMSFCVKSAEIVAYEDLGAEAVRKLYVEDLPLAVNIAAEG